MLVLRYILYTFVVVHLCKCAEPDEEQRIHYAQVSSNATIPCGQPLPVDEPLSVHWYGISSSEEDNLVAFWSASIKTNSFKYNIDETFFFED